ncbi:MAG: helix-turn-helix domain-containing protein [Gammaproteobacteria bacterium]|nr:helix-turn-helix domain-containing protein [Sideroxydans sp.]MBU4045163.1 helix-turn-helix domain-containing protein [Gammaproteobacteria bacterium]MBU4151090.1 helix-turn-helix domain-containing protein [Gammaproteobacteria bacterium]
MANLTSMLKDEISRISRKELRGETDKLKKTSTQYRSEIASLKRRTSTLEQQVGRLEKLVSKLAGGEAPSSEPASKPRFTAKGFKSHRNRLGLSAEAVGSLLGVSAQTVYSWEAGKSSPRASQMERVVALRALGKRAAAELLNR